MGISPFCDFYDQKTEYDAILYRSVRMMQFTTGAYNILNSTIFNHMQSCAVQKNDIIFCCLIMKMTKC